MMVLSDEQLFSWSDEVTEKWNKGKTERIKRKLEEVEGNLWGRYKQIHKWSERIKREVKNYCRKSEELTKLQDRRIKILRRINKIRILMEKEPYGKEM